MSFSPNNRGRGRRLSTAFDNFRNKVRKTRIDSLLSPPKSAFDSPELRSGEPQLGQGDLNGGWSQYDFEDALPFEKEESGGGEEGKPYTRHGIGQSTGFMTDPSSDTVEDDSDRTPLLGTPYATCRPRPADPSSRSDTVTMSTGNMSRYSLISSMTSVSEQTSTRSVDTDIGVPLSRQGPCEYQIQVQTEPQTAEQTRLQSTFKSLDQMIAEAGWEDEEEFGSEDEYDGEDQDQGQRKSLLWNQDIDPLDKIYKGKRPAEEGLLHPSTTTRNLHLESGRNSQPNFVMPDYHTTRRSHMPATNPQRPQFTSRFSSSSSEGGVWVTPATQDLPPWYQTVWPNHEPQFPQTTWPGYDHVQQHGYPTNPHTTQTYPSICQGQTPSCISDTSALMDPNMNTLAPIQQPQPFQRRPYSGPPTPKFYTRERNYKDDMPVSPNRKKSGSGTAVPRHQNQLQTQPNQNLLAFSHTPPLHPLPASSYTSLSSPESISAFHNNLLTRLSAAISKGAISPSRIPLGDRVRRISTDSMVARGVRRVGRGVGDVLNRAGEGIVASGAIGLGWRDVSLEAEREGRVGRVSVDLVYYGSGFI